MSFANNRAAGQTLADSVTVAIGDTGTEQILNVAARHQSAPTA
jgi:hypothetical protein